jgi:hypothetical protein
MMPTFIKETPAHVHRRSSPNIAATTMKHPRRPESLPRDAGVGFEAAELLLFVRSEAAGFGHRWQPAIYVVRDWRRAWIYSMWTVELQIEHLV